MRFACGMLAVCAVLALAHTAPAATLPANFREDVVFRGLTQPIAMAFSPDGRIFVAEKSGLLKSFSSEADTTAEVVADLRTNVHDQWDRGLLSLALHPNYPMVDAVYVLYTYDAPIGGTAPVFRDACADPNGRGCVVGGRLSKLTNTTGAGAVSEQVLIEDWCQQFPSHSIGSLAFGPDGALYVTAGDGASFTTVDSGQSGNPCGDPPGEGGALRAQDLRTTGDPTSLDGAVLRVDPMTGAGLPSNPLAASPDPNARRIVAHGLRNPFRIAFRPGTDELWVGDVGWEDWEELNRIPSAGDAVVENFGWPCYEGDRSGSARQAGYDAANLAICEDLYRQPGAVTAPAIAYRHGEQVTTDVPCPLGGASLSGLAFQFYSGGPYPREYDGALFFADYSRSCIWVAKAGPNGLPSAGSIQSFVGGAAYPVQLVLSPGGELFSVDIAGGTIRRVRYVAPPPGAEDLARGRPATASSVEKAGLEAAKAVDGSSGTRWASAYGDGAWWQVDLGSARQIDRVRLNWETAYASRSRVSTSTDGTTWTTAAEVTATQAGVQTVAFTPRTARYVRVTGLERATAWGISLWDVNVYAPASTENSAPTARASASPDAGPAPLTVTFDGTASSDPDGDALSYAWDLDGDGVFTDATTARPTWTYERRGKVSAGLRVADGRGASATASVDVTVGGPPVPTIATPETTLRWSVGDTVAFSGSAVDAEGEPLPASSLSWTLALEHGDCPQCHEHQIQTFDGVASGTFRAPDHDYPSELELRLTATGEDGLRATRTLRLKPRTTALTLASDPPGLSLTLGGSAVTAPATRTVITGGETSLGAPSPQTLGGSTWAFSAWSDGGAASHTITAPADATTYTASFTGTAAPVEKARGRPATASSVEKAGLEAGKAVDGSGTTRWASAYGEGGWWQVDLGSARQVDTVRAVWEAAYAAEYRISTSTDGTTFTTAADVTATGADARVTTFAPRAARYVRITSVRRGTTYGVSLWEVEVLGPPDTTEPPSLVEKARGRPAAASASENATTFAPGRAVDGSATTRWASAWGDGHWWEVDLGSARQISSVRIDWEAAYAARYRISTATTAGAWSTAAEPTAAGAGPVTTTFPARPARWVRVTTLQRGSPYGVSFWEAGVLGPPDG